MVKKYCLGIRSTAALSLRTYWALEAMSLAYCCSARLAPCRACCSTAPCTFVSVDAIADAIGGAAEVLLLRGAGDGGRGGRSALGRCGARGGASGAPRQDPGPFPPAPSGGGEVGFLEREPFFFFEVFWSL